MYSQIGKVQKDNFLKYSGKYLHINYKVIIRLIIFYQDIIFYKGYKKTKIFDFT